MRYLIFGVLIAFSMSANALADDMTFRNQVAIFLTKKFRPSEALPDKSEQVGLSFSIDRNGKLLSVEVDQKSGSERDDEDALDRLRKMQPFPHVPDDLQAPYKIDATVFMIPPGRVGHINLAEDPASSGQENAFKKRILDHLRAKTWTLPENVAKPSNVRSTFAFTIDRDGKLINVKITKRFGLEAADRRTVDWLKKREAFPSLPAELKAPMTLTANIVLGRSGNDEAESNDNEVRRKINSNCHGC
jgi:TonB family protein